jgi:uncharacterized membrane protein YhaH (DUF805 family)
MDKRFAPTLILILVIICILLYGGVIVWALSQEGIRSIWLALIFIIPLIIIIALITVYIERLREIDEEEKDDLSKY